MSGRRSLFVLHFIHHIILMFDRQNLLTIEPNLDKRLIFFGEPESLDFLVLSHEVGAFDRERQFLRRMPLDPNHGVVVNINPQFTLK